MARHRYRVVKRLPWIEGGRPAPGFQWEGGRVVVYQAGDTVEVDDRDLAGVYTCLEGIDDAGRTALEAVRTDAEAPARRTAVGDLHPRAVEWLNRALDERARRQGHLRELCLRLIARGDDPTFEDLAAALEESTEPPPRELLEYVARLFRGAWRKPGRKAPPRSTSEDLLIQSLYHFAVEDLRTRFAHQKRPAIHQMAAEEVADLLGLSVRTVQRIVAPRPWTKDGKGIRDS